MIAAKYRFVKVDHDRAFIEDVGEGKSVTNDAESVVKSVVEHFPGKRVIYKDTTGRWDELKHKGGTFTGFTPYTEYLPNAV